MSAHLVFLEWFNLLIFSIKQKLNNFNYKKSDFPQPELLLPRKGEV